jgi:hypothetical protein
MPPWVLSLIENKLLYKLLVPALIYSLAHTQQVYNHARTIEKERKRAHINFNF